MKKPSLTVSQTPIPIGRAGQTVSIPLYGQRIPAGFPSPAADYVDSCLDLTKTLIKHPASSFALTVKGDSMIGAGIQDGNLIIVDGAIEAKHGDIVVAEVNGEFTLKRLYRRGGKLELRAENPSFPPITFKDGDELVVFGVVMWILTPTCKRG